MKQYYCSSVTILILRAIKNNSKFLVGLDCSTSTDNSVYRHLD